MEAIILASTSQRRQEILKSLSIPFTVMTPNYEESNEMGVEPHELTEMHAMRKVESVIRTPLRINTPWILGADTLISVDGKPYGKPGNRDEARQMIKEFSGITHDVFTSICLFDAATQYTSTKTSKSTVTFMELTDVQIEKYLDTGEWQGVAGGYRIQGLASCFISSITGSFSGIVGLPIHELYAILREHGYGFII